MIDEEIERLLSDILSGIRRTLGDRLVGLYLYGSVATDGFEPGISDVDLLAATDGEVTADDLEHLEKMHAELVRRFPAWDDRIEVIYYSVEALGSYKQRRSPIAVISPGEPFHTIEADKEWLLNWYFVQDYGITLFGPSPRTFIDPISKDEFIRAVVHHAHQWPEWMPNTRHSRPYQSYAVLTMCRSLYTYKHGQQVSKKQAAHWAQKELPQWATLIQAALEWRLTARLPEPVDHEATYPQARRFVHYVSDLLGPE